ncbi:MAG: hypothetical protein AAFO82_04900 [Bacteroidota bacterium]
MVTVNANMDLKTNECLDTGLLNDVLIDLSESNLGITFIAREEEDFPNEAWISNGKTYMQVVLPYQEVLEAENANLIAYQQLYKQLDMADWLDTENIKTKLQHKISELN